MITSEFLSVVVATCAEAEIAEYPNNYCARIRVDARWSFTLTIHKTAKKLLPELVERLKKLFKA